MRDVRKMSSEEEEKREIGERLRRDIDLIVGKLHGKRVQVREKIEVSFVDREVEARAILEGVAGIRLLGGTVVLYGPWGCGKSTLVEKLTESIMEVSKSRESFFEAVYVKWDEARKIVRAVSSRRMLEIIKDAIKSLDPSVSLEGGVIVSAAPSLGRFFGSVIDALQRSKKVRDHGRILLVMDERRVESEEDARMFARELDSLADEVRRANLKYYQEKRGHLTALILASDALAAEAWQKVGGKVDWLFMWNLPRDAFERLADQLGIDMDRDLLWRLTGGNPRVLGLIKDIGLEKWFADFVGDRVVSALTRYWEQEPERTRRAVKEVAENPDRLAVWGKPYAPPLEDIFLERNIAIRIAGLPGPITEIPREPWIGERYAYQLPAYYYTLRAIARRGDLKISPEDMIREARETSS